MERNHFAFEPTAAPAPFEPNSAVDRIVVLAETLGTSPGHNAPPNLELDETLAPVQGEAATQPVIRAGRRQDYEELLTIERAHYVFGHEIARGGMGRVSAARDRRLGRPVAIKELLTDSQALRTRFEREARITARLQHPAIVNLLEAGVWPSGEPFYVMKLVSGESLDKVIERCETVNARLALLPNVIAAVDALAYAHSMRVVHRDLKPANLLVGKFGETIVIDWGLAKDLTDVTASHDLDVGPYRNIDRSESETQAGAVMGTAAYMPPEQALGDVVDERADVYSLGAMLYHVLTGVQPYVAKTSALILLAVVAGPPRPVDVLVAGIPTDLVTIVNKAMAHRAEDRYATAKELADDLKSFQTGQLVGTHHYSNWQLVRRFVRRHRGAVAVATVAMVVVALLATLSVQRVIQEQARTENQRQLAVAKGADAEDLIYFMMVNMQSKLKQIGKLDLLSDVSAKAISYFNRKGENLTAAEQKKRALALRQLGRVLLEQGHGDEAIAQQRASLAMFRNLASRNQSDPNARANVAIAQRALGEALRPQNSKAALVEFQESLLLSQALAAEDQNIERRAEVAAALMRVAETTLVQGIPVLALKNMQAALAIEKDLIAATPNDTHRQQALAAVFSSIAQVMSSQGDTTGAMTNMQEYIKIAKASALQDPQNVLCQNDLRVAHKKIGMLLLAQGKIVDAIKELQTAVSISQSLAASDPTNAVRSKELTIGHFQLGNARLDHGETTRALEEFRAGLQSAQARASLDPKDLTSIELVSLAHERMGAALLKTNDMGALAHYQAYFVGAKNVAERDPGNANRQRNLSNAFTSLGDIFQAQGQQVKALEQYSASLAMDKVAVTKDPTNTQNLVALLSSHQKFGDTLVVTAPAQAIIEYRSSIAILQRLIAIDPTRADFAAHESSQHQWIAEALLADGHRAAAAAEYQLAREIAERLASEAPTDAVRQARVVELTKILSTCCRLARENQAR